MSIVSLPPPTPPSEPPRQPPTRGRAGAPRPPTPPAVPNDAPAALPAKQAEPDSLQALALRALEGETEAFEALHARLHGWLVRLFRQRLGGVDAEQQAEDLTQRTWAGVWRAINERRYDPTRSAISTFVYAVAYNVWLQHLKQARSRSALTEALAREQAGSSMPPSLASFAPVSDDAGTAELLDLVRACLRGEVAAAGLSPDEVDVLRGISQNESDRALADRLGISPSTAHGRKKAALAKLRGYLTSRGV